MPGPSEPQTADIPNGILLCTLGASWAVVPEVYGFLCPERLDLYGNHPRAGGLAAMRPAAPPVGELWVVTTDGSRPAAGAAALERWWTAIGAPGRLRIFVAAETSELADAEQCRAVRELTLRLCLHATAKAGPDGVLLSLAGGRKTMSAEPRKNPWK